MQTPTTKQPVPVLRHPPREKKFFLMFRGSLLCSSACLFHQFWQWVSLTRVWLHVLCTLPAGICHLWNSSESSLLETKYTDLSTSPCRKGTSPPDFPTGYTPDRGQMFHESLESYCSNETHFSNLGGWQALTSKATPRPTSGILKYDRTKNLLLQNTFPLIIIL